MRHSAKCRSQSENKNWNVHAYSKYRPAIAPAEMVISPRTPENLRPAPAPGRRARAISQVRAWNPFLGNSLSAHILPELDGTGCLRGLHCGGTPTAKKARRRKSPVPGF